MSKLTLSVDEEVVARAKRFAKRRGTSVSSLVQGYLDAVARSGEGSREGLPPAVRRFRGVLKGSRRTRDDYFEYLERKYR